MSGVFLKCLGEASLLRKAFETKQISVGRERGCMVWFFKQYFRKFQHVGLEQLCVARALESLQMDTLVNTQLSCHQIINFFVTLLWMINFFNTNIGIGQLEHPCILLTMTITTTTMITTSKMTTIIMERCRWTIWRRVWRWAWPRWSLPAGTSSTLLQLVHNLNLIMKNAHNTSFP